MNPRFQAISTAINRAQSKSIPNAIVSDYFGIHVFNRKIVQKMLPKEICQNMINAQNNLEKIKPEYADVIALAMKEWALSLGATHYCHWFQPLTGATAEKHDAFIDWGSQGQIIEKFSGDELLQGEPDASSFPSGGLRSTYEARGYTGWDPTSPVFLWPGGDGLTLCIPTVFFSWTGDVLDSKIPFHRSEKKLNDAVLKLFKLTNFSCNYIYSTLGCEQEYFVIDRALRNLRPDIVLLGKTVIGASSPKGQELQDHYFGAVKNRILAYMQDFETAALKLGIPLKTRHNEVAPAQHEVAPVFEKASIAIDHNILLMEIMRQIANKHDLACLLHEKPFQGLNGSGKHCNWSISTDNGINLLDPTKNDSLQFLIILTAVIHAVYQNAGLLRATIGSASNDYRLGGHEAPPAIISVYLGKELEEWLENIEVQDDHKRNSVKQKYNFGILTIPELSKDNTDRNRTSPFAFTGNKFEFRAVGSSANPALAMTILNAAVAHSLEQIIEDIELSMAKEKTLAAAAIKIVRKYLKESKPIRFSGDNYSEEWTNEANNRKLPNLKKSYEAFPVFKLDKTAEVLDQILTKEELRSRCEILLESYINNLLIETNVLLDLFNTIVKPVSIEYQKKLAAAINEVMTILPDEKLNTQKEELKNLIKLIDQGITIEKKLTKEKRKVFPSLEEKARHIGEIIASLNEDLRLVCDTLESIVDDQMWPLPKYRELLFIV